MSTTAVARPPVAVTLEWYEALQAATIGVQRELENLYVVDYQQRDGAKPDDRWQRQIEGSAGELACAKALGRYWPGSINTFKAGRDVGGLYEVRTRSKHYYELLIRPDDPDNRIYILVTGIIPHFQIWGWAWGHEVKITDFLKDLGNDRPKAYFYPTHLLKSLESLPEQPTLLPCST